MALSRISAEVSELRAMQCVLRASMRTIERQLISSRLGICPSFDLWPHELLCRIASHYGTSRGDGVLEHLLRLGYHRTSASQLKYLGDADHDALPDIPCTGGEITLTDLPAEVVNSLWLHMEHAAALQRHARKKRCNADDAVAPSAKRATADDCVTRFVEN